MELILKNINKIKDATIKLNGLTIIAGENDSGKSTIGKILFTAVKSLANTDKKVASQAQILLRKHVNSLYKRSYKLRNSTFFPTLTTTFINELISIGDDDSLAEFYHKKKEAIKKLDVTPRIMASMLKDLDNIFICIKEGDKRPANIATEVQYFIESEFMNKICSLNTKDSFVKLMMRDDENNYLFFSIVKDEVTKVEVTNGNFIDDATYIESPLYIHLLDSLLYATSYREISYRITFQPMVPSHIEDLMSKINDLKLVRKKATMNNNNGLESSITKTMGGRFVFDENEKTLVFKKDDMTLSPINVASGIKSFGLIQMLLKLDVINANKVLIWDEPENHLHPQWQIEFANIMVQLAKAGIPILISTHSPYFMQGIRYFSAKYSIEKYTNYYLNQICEDGLSVFNDVTKDLNQVFQKLTEPLINIVNIPK